MHTNREYINQEISLYLEEKYNCWLRFARFHCRAASLHGHEGDLLHDVLLRLISTNRILVRKLYYSTCADTNELDKYVLKMIKLNAHSPSAPYRQSLGHGKASSPLRKKSNKTGYRPAQSDVFPDICLVRKEIERANLPQVVRDVFVWRLIGESFNDWPGKQSQAQLYRYYHKAIDYLSQHVPARAEHCPQGDLYF